MGMFDYLRCDYSLPDEVQNLVEGVTTGFEKKLEVIGVGFKVALQGTKIVMALGFSHPVEVNIPSDLTVTVDKNTITISKSNYNPYNFK